MECEQLIESGIRYVISIYEPCEEDLPEEKRVFLNKMRRCLVILEERPMKQLTRAVQDEVKSTA